MLLVSQAIDKAIMQMDCSQLGGKKVFFDSQYLKGSVDEGYLVSTIREHLMAHGARLMDDKTQAEIVVEARNGGVGTDRYGMFIGTPQLTVPTIVMPQSTTIPELAVIRKTNQKGIAKLALFAYHRESGKGLWQTGELQGTSSLKEAFVFGAGPISYGTIHPKAVIAGEELPTLPRLPIPFVRSHVEDEEPEDAVKKAIMIEEPSLPPIELPQIPEGPIAPVIPVQSEQPQPANK